MILQHEFCKSADFPASFYLVVVALRSVMTFIRSLSLVLCSFSLLLFILILTVAGLWPALGVGFCDLDFSADSRLSYGAPFSTTLLFPLLFGQRSASMPSGTGIAAASLAGVRLMSKN
jgi:hypothetical protein